MGKKDQNTTITTSVVILEIPANKEVYELEIKEHNCYIQTV